MAKMVYNYDVCQVVLCFLSLSICFQCSVSIHCLHCFAYQSNQSLITLCLAGKTEPIQCPKPNDTHCITNYRKKSIGIDGRTDTEILWRSCGTQVDIHGCAVYKIHSPSATRNTRSKSNHQLSSINQGSNGDQSVYTDDNSEIFEVCAEGCATDGCMIDSAFKNKRTLLSGAITVLFSVLNILYAVQQ